MKKVYLVSVSGGKDSQATLLWTIKHYTSKGKVIAYFADTGWEAPETYEHIKYLEKELNITIHRISSDKYDGFEDMCIQRKGFPSRLRRFCTEELKIIPSNKFIRSWIDKGYKVVNITGVRRDESKSRKLDEAIEKIPGVKIKFVAKRDIENKWKTSFLGDLPKPNKRKDGTYSIPKRAKDYYSKKNSVTTMQPIVDWSARQVLEYNIIEGTNNNPLYAQGMTRVGCYPCIMANTFEIGSLKEEYVQRIIKLEKDVQDAATSGTRPVFFHKGGELTDFKDVIKKYKVNPLGFDLGCINQFGICE